MYNHDIQPTNGFVEGRVCACPEDGWLVGVTHEVLDVAHLMVHGGQIPGIDARAHLDPVGMGKKCRSKLSTMGHP